MTTSRTILACFGLAVSLIAQERPIGATVKRAGSDFHNHQWIQRIGVVPMAWTAPSGSRGEAARNTAAPGNGSADPNLIQNVPVAPMVDARSAIIAPYPPAIIAPRPGPGPALYPYFTPAEAATYAARRFWTLKQREADSNGFQWGHALWQSAILLAIEEAYRLGDQPETRAQLKGPYLKDWLNSVRGLHGWDDTDSWLANYVGHPMQGAITGYIQVQNDPRGRLQEFGKNRPYWKSRGKAFLWATAYSTFYELGPIGDAGIGNVGHVTKDPGRKGYVDLVITPTLGLALMVVEDMLDQQVVWPIEKRTNSAMAKRLLRSFLGMHRSFTNLFRLKRPWYIDSRGPVNQPAIRYSRIPGPY